MVALKVGPFIRASMILPGNMTKERPVFILHLGHMFLVPLQYRGLSNSQLEGLGIVGPKPELRDKHLCCMREERWRWIPGARDSS